MSSSAELRSLDETCCICMESKPNLILQCTHNFCEVCMKEWKITSNTCPICRCISEEQDCFVLADKLDYYHIQDEISKSLFQITDGNRKAFVKRKAERANENSEPQASHSSSDDSGWLRSSSFFYFFFSLYCFQVPCKVYFGDFCCCGQIVSGL